MNKKIFSVFIALFFAIFSTGAFAQDNRTLETKVADLLAQMPASDLGSRDRLIIEMVQLGPAVFQKITEQLTSPGKGDDTAARFAINSLSRYASEFGKEAIRDYAEINLLKALENHQDLGIKAFLLEQLNLVAGDKTVAVVKKYLNDDRLSEPATLVLLTARGENAAQALLDALPRAEGKNQVTLVKALGELHCVKAVSQITPLVNANNPNLKKVALASLANIADPNSFKTLYNSAKVKGFAYDATNAAEAFLNYTARLGENNETTRCKKACKAIFKANHSENLLHNYSKALAIYTENFGYVAMPLLLKAVDSNNRAFRYSALNLAVNTGGVAATREWVSKAQRASTEVKAEIISMLGRKGDPLAIDFIEDNLNATDPVVREESVTALVKLKGREAIPQLIGHLAEGKDIESTKAALLQLLDEKHLSPSAMKLTQTSGKVKAAMVDLIAAKSGKAYFGEILALTNSSDMDVKNAAFNAMKKISTEENLDDLINLLLSAMNENEITQVQRALVVAAKGVEKEKSESGKVLQALHHTDKKERIIVILPEIGGPVAMQTLTYNFNHSTGKTKEAAFEALTNWKDYSASSALFDICKASSGEFHEKSFSSFIRLVGSANLPDDQKLLQYQNIMTLTANQKEKATVIQSIGNLKIQPALEYLEGYLDDSGLQQTAARAIMKIALPGTDGTRGLSGERARNILERIIPLLKGDESDYDKINIKNYLEQIPQIYQLTESEKKEGFVSLFSGINLDGWQGDTIGYFVENGMIVISPDREGNGIGRLYTAKVFSDFVFRFDFQLTPGANNGLGIRTPLEGTAAYAAMEIQILDDSAPVYSNLKEYQYHGSVYGVIPAKRGYLKPVGEWNSQEVIAKGTRIKVILNGHTILDGDIAEASKNGTIDHRDHPGLLREKGHIGFLGHGTIVRFRNIRIKEINLGNDDKDS